MNKIYLGLVILLLLTGCGTSGEVDEPQSVPNTSVVTSTLPPSESQAETTTEAAEVMSETPTTSVAEITTEIETTTEAPTTLAEAETQPSPTVTSATTTIEKAGNWSDLNASRFQVEEVKALWLTYLDLQPIFERGSALAYKAAMLDVVNDAKELGLNTIMFQVRPFGDALYESALFPTSYVITGVEGAPLAFDPLQVMIDIAHAEGIRVEAWINPYRIRTNTSSVPLADSNLAKVWLDDGSRRVLMAGDGTIVYNPSNAEAKARIIDGVKEIIYQYGVDGIHFDDYFYPTTDMAFDEIEYLGFLHDSDELSQADWRRYHVNDLVARVYEAIQASEGNLVFGISPQGTISTNYDLLYADVALWLSQPGYLDYVVPQIYFGFNNTQAPFSETLSAWHELNRLGIDIIPGLAVYKVGLEDQWAGEGVQEWVEDIGIIGEMIEAAKSYDNYKGFALYRYDYLFKPESELVDRMSEEIDIIKTVLGQ